jgi:hypothetical protein
VRPSIRFLALAVLGWAGFRAASLGVLPGADVFRVPPSEAKTPSIVETQFPPLEPVPAAAPIAPPVDAPLPQAAIAPGAVRYVQGLIGVPVSMGRGVVPVYKLPPPTPAASPDRPPPATRLAYTLATRDAYSELPPLRDWPLSGIGGVSYPVTGANAAVPGQSVPKRLDRLQLSSWALLRSQQSVIAGSRSLASGGQLGASQAGARLVYNFNRQLALAGRLSSEVGRRGGEVAAGIRVQPLVSVPIWLTAERRQAIGRYGGGRSDFALFLEGGLYERPLPWNFALDTYFQGGVVGVRTRDLFFDGALTVTRPLFRNFSAGLGVWGGAQPGLSRVDAGPRLTMRVRKNLKVHVDWRQKLAGNARPGSGPALTLSGDF